MLVYIIGFWNIIQYYFPYKHLIEEDWKDVLKEFIPKYIHANSEIEYKLVVLELIARIHDTHANIWGQDEVLKNYWGVRYAPDGKDTQRIGIVPDIKVKPTIEGVKVKKDELLEKAIEIIK